MAFPRKIDNVDCSMGTIPQASVVTDGTINELIVCTYDESHVVPMGRYHAHIEKCAKRFGVNVHNREGEMLVCPFNPSHHVHDSVMEMHIEMCDDHYKFQMEHQEDPPSMSKTYDRYKIVEKPLETKLTLTFATEDDEDYDVYESDKENQDGIYIKDVKLKQLDGTDAVPSTVKEMRARQVKIVKEMLKQQRMDEVGKAITPVSTPVDTDTTSTTTNPAPDHFME